MVKSQTSCSRGNRQSNIRECLETIRDGFRDKSKFWFGADFAERCPEGSRNHIDCVTWLMPSDLSLENIMFRVFDDRLINRYLDITFTSPPGE